MSVLVYAEHDNAALNKVTLSVSTHDANGITQKDFDLADATDKLVG